MKNLLVILILSLSLSLQSQSRTTWQKVSRPLGVIAWNIAATSIGAYGDAIRDDGNNIGWALNGVEAAMFVGGKWVFNIKGFDEHAAYICSFGFTRAALFDMQYNTHRELPWSYTGSTKLWDKAWQELNPPPMGKGWFYGWCFSLSVAIPLKHL